MLLALPLPLFMALLAVLAFAATALLTAALARALTARQMFDTPNERSMHTAKVPRGGGLAVVAVLAAGMVSLLYVYRDFAPREIWLLWALLPIVAVSWMDDRHGAGIRIKLGAQFAAALLGMLALPPDALALNGMLPFVLDRAMIVIGWVWFMNLYNFMDGIDGITGTETMVIALGAGLLLTLPDTHTNAFGLGLAALLVGAAGGFLMLNAPPAKIFLGDVGSVPLGFLTGWLMLVLATHGMLAAALILPLYYLADSGITLVTRMLRREKFWLPHRQHFYQRASMGLGRHAPAVLWIGLTGLGLVLAALVSVLAPWPCLTAAAALVAVLLVLLNNAAAKA